MTQLVMCRRGPERQAGAARPDLTNAAMLPYAQPLKHCATAGADPGRVRATWKAAGRPRARSRCSTRQR